MNIERLSESLIRTISDPDYWSVALADLSLFLGVDRVLISLRDLKTARIVIPEAVAANLASPLIHGFSAEEIGDFIATHAEHDPWTPIERENYPFTPYAMSRYLPIRKLMETHFWKWLAPMGVNDSVVAEIARTDSYWVAINVYFHAGTDRTPDAVVSRLRQVLPILRAAWASRRDLEIARSAHGSLDIVLDAVTTAAIVIDRRGRIVSLNAVARALLRSWSLDAEPGKALTLPGNLRIEAKDDVHIVDVPRSEPQPYRGRAYFSGASSNESIDGEVFELSLVIIDDLVRIAARSGSAIWDSPGLTQRERTLVEIVATGKRLKDAQDEMGVSHQRIMQLWRSARTKLGVADLVELRLAHQMQAG